MARADDQAKDKTLVVTARENGHFMHHCKKHKRLRQNADRVKERKAFKILAKRQYSRGRGTQYYHKKRHTSEEQYAAEAWPYRDNADGVVEEPESTMSHGDLSLTDTS